MDPLDENIAIKQLGEKIKELRKEQNSTQSQLSFEANIPRVQIGRIERGEVNTTVKTLVAIANALNVHPKVFFDF